MPKPSSGFVAIVDDDPAVRKAVARLLDVFAIRSRAYGSAREFLDALPCGVADCLIVDLHMPEMSGLDLLGELAPSGARIPSIVITARDESGLRRRCLEAGAAAYLVKPLDACMLLASIGSAIA